MFKRPKEPEKNGSEKREDLLVSFLTVVRFVFAIIEFFITLLYEKNVFIFYHSPFWYFN